jgi:hypothetical protein
LQRPGAIAKLLADEGQLFAMIVAQVVGQLIDDIIVAV